MPERPLRPTVPRTFNGILERLRAVERLVFKQKMPDIPIGVSAYSWQSSQVLVPGFGHKLYADRDGEIAFIRAERSAADGTSTATFDVFHNGNSIFVKQPNPTVPAGDAIGAERFPDLKAFRKGDNFQVEIIDTGGGSGPLRVTIRYDPRTFTDPPNEFDEIQ